MNKKKLIEELFGFTEATYYNWKKERRPIIDFFEKYINITDISLFLEQKRIPKLELVNNATIITFKDMKMMTIIWDKIETFVQDNKINREGFIIKLYRTLRDLPEDTSEYKEFFNTYNMKTFEALKNVMWGSDTKDIVNFYEEYLSKKEIVFMFDNKNQILPPLKAMRKYNAHIND